MTAFEEIRHGDTITIATVRGQRFTGKAHIFNKQYQMWVLLDPKKSHGGSGCMFADKDNTISIRAIKH